MQFANDVGRCLSTQHTQHIVCYHTMTSLAVAQFVELYTSASRQPGVDTITKAAFVSLTKATPLLLDCLSSALLPRTVSHGPSQLPCQAIKLTQPA